MATYTLELSQATLNALANTTGIGNTTSGVVTYPGGIVLTSSVPTYISQNITTDGTGDLRSIPIQNKSSSYTLTKDDNGQCISITTGGVTVSANVFNSGQVVTIYNNSTFSQIITQGSGVTLYQAGSGSTGNRTLSPYGVATVLCVTSNIFVITGNAG